MGVNIDVTEAASGVNNDVVNRNRLISVLYRPPSLAFLSSFHPTEWESVDRDALKIFCDSFRGFFVSFFCIL